MLTLELKSRFNQFMETSPEWHKRLEGLMGHYQFGYAGWNDRWVVKDMRHRILFEVDNPDGGVYGLCGRSADGRIPKYKHPIGYPKGKTLFNISKCSINKPVVLVEGNIDAMSSTINFQQAVALEGINFSIQQQKLLTKFGKVILALDKDDAGKMAMIIIASRIMKETNLFIANWTGFKDIDELYLNGGMVEGVVPVTPELLAGVWNSCVNPTKQPFVNNTVMALQNICGSRMLMEHGVQLPPVSKKALVSNLNHFYDSDKTGK